MTDPNTPGQNPQPTTPTPPAYGEYATTPPPAQAPGVPAYNAPAYAAAPAYSAGGAPTGPVPGKTLGIVAFVVSLFAGLVGLILGIVALVQSKKAGRGNGFAIAAIIIGALSVVVGLIVLFAVIVPSINAATTCLDNPTAIVTVWGVDLPCSQVIEQSGR